MRIVSTKEMIDIEQKTKSEYFFEASLIVENSGVQGSLVLANILNEHQLNEEVVFLIGKGNNGADGLSIARHLRNMGHRCRAFMLFSKDECNDLLLKQVNMARAYGVSVNEIDNISQVEGYFEQMGHSVIVDALFGTGVQLPLSNFLYEIINYINDNAVLTVSVDVPSGVEGDSGRVQGNAIEADYTMAIGFPKLGHFVANGAKHSGELFVLDIGIPKKEKDLGDKFLLGPDCVSSLVGRRDKFADKKVYGHSLILGGSHGLIGAPVLASHAALRVGSGLVTCATWEPQYDLLNARLIPEIMTGYLPLDVNKWSRLIQDLNKYSSIVIGPGLARSSRSRRLVLEVLNNFDGPVIIDADAINVMKLEEDVKAFRMRNAPTVLTPHFGEFAKFTGIDIEDLKENPVQHLKEVIEKINCTVVLKGPCSYLGYSDGRVFFNYFPNDGLATGGSGDVLAGLLCGLMAQEPSLSDKNPLVAKYKVFNDTVGLAVYLHTIAGEVAAKKFGVRSMSALSLVEALPDAFNELDKRLTEYYEEIGHSEL